MRVDDFDFTLPEANIALRPAQPRDSARMLIVGPGAGLADKTVTDLTDYLRPGDALVFNDTKVIPARLFGERRRDDAVARIEVTLHKRVDESHWLAFARPAKRLKSGDRITFGDANEACDAARLEALVVERGEGGEITLAFDLAGPALDDAIVATGSMPLPPYIASKRTMDARDLRDYQTVYADEPGAVAAPTAGLHFTDEMLERLKAQGVELHKVTLHVGAGTFLPVTATDTKDHKMHAEFGVVRAETAAALNRVHADGGRVIAVGTTSLRLLESAVDQNGEIHSFADDTDIFITPGYQFRAIDGLMTNFHLPKSTLFMLVSAFMGLETMKTAYNHAVQSGYRFYSYGDASLLLRDTA